MDAAEEKKEREWIVSAVRDGAKSRYWDILRDVVMEWLRAESKYLDGFKSRGIKNDDEREKYNAAVARMENMRKFLTINETIIQHNTGVINVLKNKITETVRHVESFVKEAVSNGTR